MSRPPSPLTALEHVGCCDSSPGKHARGHAHGIGHPIVQAYLPPDDWRWCYFDETYV